MVQARSPAIFDGEPTRVRQPSATLGQHTDELLRAAGCAEAEIAALRAAGAVG